MLYEHCLFALHIAPRNIVFVEFVAMVGLIEPVEIGVPAELAEYYQLLEENKSLLADKAENTSYSKKRKPGLQEPAIC